MLLIGSQDKIEKLIKVIEGSRAYFDINLARYESFPELSNYLLKVINFEGKFGKMLWRS